MKTLDKNPYPYTIDLRYLVVEHTTLGVSWVNMQVRDAALYLLHMTDAVKYILCWYENGSVILSAHINHNRTHLRNLR